MGISNWLENWFDDLTPKKLTATLIVLWFAIGAVMATCNILFRENYEITVTGTVSSITLEHDRVFNYDYTRVRFITFRGSGFEHEFLDHINLDFGSTYRIVYKRTSPLGYHVWLYDKVVNVTQVDIPERWAWYPP